jgi:hypothetical protein
MGNSFGYASDDHDHAFLAAVARALKPGGKFALDYGAVAEALLPNIQPRTWAKIGDTLFLRDARYNVDCGRVETDYTLIHETRPESKSWSQRVYTYRQVHDLFTQSGFTDLHPTPRSAKTLSISAPANSSSSQPPPPDSPALTSQTEHPSRAAPLTQFRFAPNSHES